MTSAHIASDGAAVDDPPGSADASWSGWYALAVLIAATLFSIADRYIFSLLAEPIRVGMRLSDLQIGLLQGFGLALFAAAVSYPIGWLADRYDRRLILVGCIAVWSGGVVACGMARTFAELFVASAVVGGGEAGLIPIVFGLIPEVFRNRKRIVANAVYSATTKLGASLGVAFCGWVVWAVEHHRALLPESLRALDGWRLAFFGAATPALVIIPLLLSIRLPQRTAVHLSGDAEPAASVLPYLRAQRATLIPFLVAMGFVTLGSVAAISWVPMIAMRLFHETAVSVGSGLAVSNLAGGIVGFGVSVFGLRVLTPRVGLRLPMRVIWVSTAASALASLLVLAATNAVALYAIQGVQVAFTMAAFMVYPTVIQDLAPPQLRSRIASLSYLSSIVLGSMSPIAVGALSDAMKAYPRGLLIASVVVAVAGFAIAAVLMLFAEHGYLRTLRAAADPDAVH